MTAYIPPGQRPTPPPAAQHNSYIPPRPGLTQPGDGPAPQALAPSNAELHTQIAGETLRLPNRLAWRTICQALGNAGVTPGPGFGTAARAVWTERKARRRAARDAGLAWRPLGKAQLRAAARAAAQP